MNHQKAYLLPKTLSEITFPGTHDSGTYDLMYRVSPELVPWEAELLDVIEDVAPEDEVFDIINGWSKAQNFSLYDQLVMGIRYFDIRVCWDSDTNLFRIHHLIMSNTSLQESLSQIASFLNEHPSEFLIIQLSHFAGLSHQNHVDLISYIKSTFKTMLLPTSVDYASTSLGTILGTGFQILIFYDDTTSNSVNFLWPTWMLWSEWANQDRVDTLRQFQVENVGNFSGNSKLFYFPQWILTPRPIDVIDGLIFSPRNLHEISRQANSQFDAFYDEIETFRINVMFVDWFQETDMLDRVISVNHVCNDAVQFRNNAQVPNCHQYMRDGRCMRPDAFMQQTCKMTCGLCSVNGEPGDACRTDADCLSHGCLNGTCMGYSPGGNGSWCGRNTQCSSGLCQNFLCG
eukprot:TRINITY_DN4759_c0_g1_i1.p1 TRINITY_DN4759_c0_g1~~TRINITY_DN4759_c0_g1_i1.p1  ORF type:complete len:429 (+),score=115.85 TRINITY_DN4759_c0_g1_i1:87-1289(+)